MRNGPISGHAPIDVNIKWEAGRHGVFFIFPSLPLGIYCQGFQSNLKSAAGWSRVADCINKVWKDYFNLGKMAADFFEQICRCFSSVVGAY